MELVLRTYKLTNTFPKEELYTLTSQMRRAAVSIPSNIAEGHQRNLTKNFIRVLSMAKGSNAELQTQLYICNSLGYIDIKETESIICDTIEIDKMLYRLMESLEKQ